MNRRRFLQRAAMAAALAGLARAEEPALLAEDDPKAKALHYVEDIRRSAGDQTHTCASCGLYQGEGKSLQGPCLLFPKRLVKASGTCSGWAPQM